MSELRNTSKESDKELVADWAGCSGRVTPGWCHWPDINTAHHGMGAAPSIASVQTPHGAQGSVSSPNFGTTWTSRPENIIYLVSRVLEVDGYMLNEAKNMIQNTESYHTEHSDSQVSHMHLLTMVTVLDRLPGKQVM